MKIATLTMALGLTATLLGGCCKKKDDSATTDPTPPMMSATATAATSAPTAMATTTTTTTAMPTMVPTVAPKPVTNDADAAAIRGCCAALRRATAGEPNPTSKGKLKAATSTCENEVGNVQRGATTRASALASIRANNGGKPLPGGCN